MKLTLRTLALLGGVAFLFWAGLNYFDKTLGLARRFVV
jgi:hypothetical protein